MDAGSWPAEWLRALLGVWILSVVARAETHGYAIAKQLRAAGLAEPKGGTLYPALARLEEDGLLRSRWSAGEGGPGRKLFSLTPAGGALLAERTRDWHRLVHRMDAVLPATDEEV